MSDIKANPEQSDSDLLLCVRGEITSEEYVRRLRRLRVRRLRARVAERHRDASGHLPDDPAYDPRDTRS